MPYADEFGKKFDDCLTYAGIEPVQMKMLRKWHGLWAQLGEPSSDGEFASLNFPGAARVGIGEIAASKGHRSTAVTVRHYMGGVVKTSVSELRSLYDTNTAAINYVDRLLSDDDSYGGCKVVSAPAGGNGSGGNGAGSRSGGESDGAGRLNESRGSELNRRPTPYHGVALPTELPRQTTTRVRAHPATN